MRYALTPGVHTIGRAAESSLCLNHIAISRKHCVVSVDASGDCMLSDTGSRNGTLVGGTRITEPVPLKPGDIISIGVFQLVLVGHAEMEGKRAAPEPGGLEWAAVMGYLDTAYDPDHRATGEESK